MKESQSILTEPENYFDQGDYFSLREWLDSNSGSISRKESLYWSAICKNAFNDCQGSNKDIADFFRCVTGGSARVPRIVKDKNGASENEDLILQMLRTRAENYMRSHKYAKAAADYKRLKRLCGELTRDESRDLDNNIALCSSLADVKPQAVRIKRTTIIPFQRNRFDHMELAVDAAGQRYNFILDTGANYCTVSQTCALGMGMHVREAEIEVGTATGITIKARPALCPSLSVGGIEFSNIVFLVIPDKELTFEEIGYRIDAILGFPVLNQLAELRISKNFICVPSRPVDRPLGNLCLEGLMPIVRTQAMGENLRMSFDTGANRTELSYGYFKKHIEQIEKYGRRVTARRGGGGGIVEGECREIPDFCLKVGSRTVHLPAVMVMTEEYPFIRNKDGNMGQDIFTQFGYMVINFRHMYIDLEDPSTVLE